MHDSDLSFSHIHSSLQYTNIENTLQIFRNKLINYFTMDRHRNVALIHIPDIHTITVNIKMNLLVMILLSCIITNNEYL